MEFKLLFRSHPGYPVEVARYEIGLNGLSVIRDKTGINLELRRVHGFDQGKTGDITVEISENIAELSGHFQTKNSVSVTVKRGHLNQFTYQRVETQANINTGEIYSAWIQTAIDEKALLSAWRDAGFPLKWEIEE
jgi:hypothetical protein